MQKEPAELFFIPPMDCKEVVEIPEDKEWLYEIKHDGYRAILAKNSKKAKPKKLRSRLCGLRVLCVRKKKMPHAKSAKGAKKNRDPLGWT